MVVKSVKNPSVEGDVTMVTSYRMNTVPAKTGYVKCSAAGSRLTTCTDRLMFSQCLTMVLQYVD